MHEYRAEQIPPDRPPPRAGPRRLPQGLAVLLLCESLVRRVQLHRERHRVAAVLLAPGGRLLLAGVLEGRLDALVAAMAPLVEIERDAEGGWGAVSLAASG